MGLSPRRQYLNIGKLKRACLVSLVVVVTQVRELRSEDWLGLVYFVCYELLLQKVLYTLSYLFNYMLISRYTTSTEEAATY